MLLLLYKVKSHVERSSKVLYLEGASFCKHKLFIIFYELLCARALFVPVKFWLLSNCYAGTHLFLAFIYSKRIRVGLCLRTKMSFKGRIIVALWLEKSLCNWICNHVAGKLNVTYKLPIDIYMKMSICLDYAYFFLQISASVCL